MTSPSVLTGYTEPGGLTSASVLTGYTEPGGLPGVSMTVTRTWIWMREMTFWSRKLVMRTTLVRRRICVTRSTAYTCKLDFCLG